MDLAFVTFASVFAIAIASGAILHSIVKNYLLGVIGAAFTGAAWVFLVYGLWHGRIPHWLIFAAVLPVCALVAAAVGIPFNRRRTGKGLGEGLPDGH
jgi:ABC-type multidrug transport system permease subunit